MMLKTCNMSILQSSSSQIRFDAIPHKTLFHMKLDDLTTILTSTRKKRVGLEDEFLEQGLVAAAVQQRTVLNSILFKCHISDLYQHTANGSANLLQICLLSAYTWNQQKSKPLK